MDIYKGLRCTVIYRLKPKTIQLIWRVTTIQVTLNTFPFFISSSTATMPSATTPDPGGDPARRPLLSHNHQDVHVDAFPEKLCIDDMLQKYCGEFGWWQLRHFVLVSLAWALEAFHTMVMIFSDHQPAWRCSASSAACSPASDICGLPRDAWEWVAGPTTSVVAEWDLVCGQKYKVGLVQALFFAGCMIGAGVFGHLSDSTLGRRGSLTVVCVLNGIFGCLTALSPSYPIYVVLRLLTGFSTGGVGLCSFVLATEPVGPSKRGLAGMSTFYFFSSGISLLVAIAYTFPSWRHLYVASSLPSLLFVLLVAPFLSESPRWHVVRGRLSRAMKTMHSIAVGNDRKLPTGVTLTLDDNGDNTKTVEDEVIGGSLLDVLRSGRTRKRLFLAVTINFLCSVVYYGLSLNVVNLKTNLYFNVLLNAVAEMPAFLLTAVMIDRFGRKPLAIGTLWFSAVFCLLGSLLEAWKELRMLCGVLGIFGMAGTYNLLFIYTTELFPTVVRNAALGCATQAAQMGAILSPFVVVLGGGVPFMVFAGCGLLGGALAFSLPETLNRPLYDTMAGLEEGESNWDDEGVMDN